MRGTKFGTMRSRGWVWLLLAGSWLSPAEARGNYPKDWKVDVRAAPVSKHGMYDVTVVVRDAERRTVDGAEVRLRLHSVERRGPRFVTLRGAGKGEYRTWVRLNPPHDDPRRLHVWVTPLEPSAHRSEAGEHARFGLGSMDGLVKGATR